MKRIALIAILAVISVSFTGCIYTQSALKYAGESTKRVDDGYKAKIEMTKYLTDYLTAANKDCGVKVEIIDNKPVTTVKECIRAAEVMSSVDHIQIVKPQPVADVGQGVSNFVSKATGLVVPFASFYYGYKNNMVNQNANVAMHQSDNAAQTSMWNNYTSNYKNEVTNSSLTDKSTDTSLTNISSTDTSNTNTSTTDTSNTSGVPNIVVDNNGTTIK